MADAAVYSGISDKSKIINLALEHYIRRMAAKRLVALGGTMPDLEVPARRRMRDDHSPALEAGRALAALGGTMPDLEIPDAPEEDGWVSVPAKSVKVAEEPLQFGGANPDSHAP